MKQRDLICTPNIKIAAQKDKKGDTSFIYNQKYYKYDMYIEILL